MKLSISSDSLPLSSIGFANACEKKKSMIQGYSENPKGRYKYTETRKGIISEKIKLWQDAKKLAQRKPEKALKTKMV